MSRPKTKGELGIASGQTINTAPTVKIAPELNFSWTPHSVALSILVNGNTYPPSGDPPILTTATNQEITFTANVRSPDGDFITSYEWDFGDGRKAYGAVVSHTFTTASPSIRVILTVTDNYGRRFSMGQYLNLRAASVTAIDTNVIATTSP